MVLLAANRMCLLDKLRITLTYFGISIKTSVKLCLAIRITSKGYVK